MNLLKTGMEKVANVFNSVAKFSRWRRVKSLLVTSAPITITSFNGICKFDLITSPDWFGNFKEDFLGGQSRFAPTIITNNFELQKKEYLDKLQKHVQSVTSLTIAPDVNFYYLLRYNKYLSDISGYINKKTDLSDLLKTFSKETSYGRYDLLSKRWIIRGEAAFQLKTILELELLGKYKDSFAAIKVKIIALLKDIINFVYTSSFASEYAQGSVYEFWTIFGSYLTQKEMNSLVYTLLAITPPTNQADIDLLILTLNINTIPSYLITEIIVQRDLLIFDKISTLDDIKFLKNKVHFSFEFIITFIKTINTYTIAAEEKTSLIMHVYAWYVLLRKNGTILDNKTVPQLTELMFSWIVKSKIWLTTDDDDPSIPELIIISKKQFRYYITFIIIIFEKISAIKLVEKYLADITIIIKDVKPIPVPAPLEPILKPEATILNIITTLQLKDIWNEFSIAVLSKITKTNIYTVTFHKELLVIFQTSFKSLLYVNNIIDLTLFKNNIKEIYRFIYQTQNIHFTYICNQILKYAIQGNKDEKLIYGVLNNYIVSYLYFESGVLSGNLLNFLAGLSAKNKDQIKLMREDAQKYLQVDIEIMTAFKENKNAKVFAVISKIADKGKFKELASTDHFINTFWGTKLLLSFVDFWNSYKVKFEKENPIFIIYLNAYRYFTDKKNSWASGFEYDLVLADMEKCLGIATSQDSIDDRLKNNACSLNYASMSELYYFFKVYLIKTGKKVTFTETFFPINREFLNSFDKLLDLRGKEMISKPCDKSTNLFCRSIIIHNSLYEYLTIEEDPSSFIDTFKGVIPKPSTDEKFLFWNSIQAIRDFENADQTRITHLFSDQYDDAYFIDLFTIEKSTDLALYIRRTFQKNFYKTDLNLANSVKKIMDNEATLNSIFLIKGVFNYFPISLFVRYASSAAHFNNIAKIMQANKYSIKIIEHVAYTTFDINSLLVTSQKTADVSAAIIAAAQAIFNEEYQGICNEIENKEVEEKEEKKETVLEPQLMEIDTEFKGRKSYISFDVQIKNQPTFTQKVTVIQLNTGGSNYDINKMSSRQIEVARYQYTQAKSITTYSTYSISTSGVQIVGQKKI